MVVWRFGPRGIVAGGDSDILPLFENVEAFISDVLFIPKEDLLFSTKFLVTLLLINAIWRLGGALGLSKIFGFLC